MSELIMIQNSNSCFFVSLINRAFNVIASRAQQELQLLLVSIYPHSSQRPQLLDEARHRCVLRCVTKTNQEFRGSAVRELGSGGGGIFPFLGG